MSSFNTSRRHLNRNKSYYAHRVYDTTADLSSQILNRLRPADQTCPMFIWGFVVEFHFDTVIAFVVAPACALTYIRN